jgi:thiol-disulfide isomerase/thioredoxin
MRDFRLQLPRPIIRAGGYCPPMVSTARVRAPELEGSGGFIGTAGPLTLAALRGRVVLLDFFTESCINCIHVLEELRELERQFGDDLLVIGIHSPKFPHEHDHEAVVRAVERLGITHPVLDDPELRTWSAYAVTAWPTLVLIDPEGYIAHQVSGEGQIGFLAQGIATLLDAHGAKGTLVRGPRPVVPSDPPPRTGLRYPGKVAHDPERGLLAVSDTGHHRIVLLDGAGAVRDIIGTGEPARRDGSFGDAALQSPQGVTFWRGSLWIADTGNHRLRRADLETRELHTVGGPLRSPWDVAPYADDILVIAMAGTHQLWGYDPNYDRTGVVAGSGREGLLDGPAVQADLAQPSGVASLGRLLGFVDAETSSLRVLAPADRGGVEVATVVGSGLFEWGDRDGSIGEARLQHPTGIAALPRGFVVSDTFNHRLRSVHMETGVVATIAGHSPGFRDGTGSEARFFEPGGIARIDSVLIVADTGNHALRRVEIETGMVTSLLPMGLEPPAAPARRLEPVVLAENAVVTLLVTLDAPPGTHLDTSAGAPVHLRLSAAPAEAIGNLAPQTATALPAAITVHTGTGAGALRIEVRGAFCDDAEGEGAACRIAESAFVVPFTLAPGGLARLTLE